VLRTVSTILRHVKAVPPLDQVHARSRLDHAAHLALLQVKGSLLKLLLHVAPAKEAPGDVSVSPDVFSVATSYRSPPLRALLQSDSVVASSDRDLALGSSFPSS